jgi:hypothetical protein
MGVKNKRNTDEFLRLTNNWRQPSPEGAAGLQMGSFYVVLDHFTFFICFASRAP